MASKDKDSSLSCLSLQPQTERSATPPPSVSQAVSSGSPNPHGPVATMNQSMSAQLLDHRADAEDECVKDLVREMRRNAGLADQSGGLGPRSTSDPAPQTPVENLPAPELGRFRDVAQPGGFRRHHVRQTNDNDSSDGLNQHVQTSLVQLLLPMIIEDDLVDSEFNDSFHTPAPPRPGDASNLAVAFVIAKNFFGSAFMITPKGFQEAGILGGPICLLGIFSLELRCMLNLIKCRKIVGPARYEDLGTAIGPWFTKLITFMIMLCQFGFLLHLVGQQCRESQHGRASLE